MTSVSPFKKFKSASKEYIEFARMSNLKPHKPYRVYNIVHTEHESYGPGELAYIETNVNKKLRVQLPGKYLKTLTLPDDINFFKNEIKENRKPYLVYRCTLDDKSFEIDFIPDSEDMRRTFSLWEDVPALEDSINSLNESDGGDAGINKAVEDGKGVNEEEKAGNGA